MPDIYYWVRSAITASSANTTTYWSLNDNTGATTGHGQLPGNASDDIAVFGDATIMSNGLGFGACTWDIPATTLGEIVINEGFKDFSNLITTDAQFVNSSNKIEFNDVFPSDEFFASQLVEITGTEGGANDAQVTISSIAGQSIVVSSVSADETVSNYPVQFAAISRFVDFTTAVTLNGLYVDGTIDNTSGSNTNITFTGEHLGASSYTVNSANYNDRYVLNGPNALIKNIGDITYLMTAGSTTDRTHFDDGPHPIVRTTANEDFSPQYKTPTTTDWGVTMFHKFQIAANSATLAPDPSSNNSANDYKKIFVIQSNAADALDFDPNTFNAGFSTWTFTCASAGFEIPTTGTTTYGNGAFVAKFHDIVIRPSGRQGDYVFIPSNKKLFCYSFTLEPDAMLIGSGSANTTTLISVSKPNIKGTWNYIEISPGVYQYGADVLNGSYNDLFVNDKLTVGGLIDPTGLELTGVATNPGNSNTIWCDAPGVMYWAGGLRVNNGTLYVSANDGRVGINALSPNSTFHTEGSVSRAITTITSETTLTESHYVIICDFGSNTNVYLPAAASCPGREYIIRGKQNSSDCVLNVEQIGPGPGPDRIDDNSSSTSINIGGGKSRVIISDGSIWYCVTDIGV